MSIDRFVSHLAVMGLAAGVAACHHAAARSVSNTDPDFCAGARRHSETPGASPAATRRRTCRRAARAERGGHLQPRIARLAERLASAVGRLLRLRPDRAARRCPNRARARCAVVEQVEDHKNHRAGAGRRARQRRIQPRAGRRAGESGEELPGEPRHPRHAHFGGQPGQGVTRLPGRDRELLVAEPPRPFRDHGEIGSAKGRTGRKGRTGGSGPTEGRALPV